MPGPGGGGPGLPTRAGPWVRWLTSLAMLAFSAFGALVIGPDLLARIREDHGAPAAARIEGWQRLMDFARDFE